MSSASTEPSALPKILLYFLSHLTRLFTKTTAIPFRFLQTFPSLPISYQQITNHLLHREKKSHHIGTTSTCHHQTHKPTCIYAHPSSSSSWGEPISRTWAFHPTSFHLLRDLSHSYIFNLSFSNSAYKQAHMSSILNHKICLNPLVPPQLLPFLLWSLSLCLVPFNSFPLP